MKQSKNILLVSPIEKMVAYFKENTISKFNLSNDIVFFELNFDCKSDAQIENLYKLLFKVRGLKKYIGVIVLYPKNDVRYQYSHEQFSAINDLFRSKKMLLGGIVICDVSIKGEMVISEQKELKKHLNKISNFKNKIYK